MLPGLLAGQNSDTLLLKGVTVSAAYFQHREGQKNIQMDSVTLQMQEQTALSGLLAAHSPVFIKTYGQGGLATSSFRGTSAAHTQVLWNGISINSPMLGQVDFSLIPVVFSDRVTLNFGSAAISESSGSLGGSIQLNNDIPQIKKNKTALALYGGSFNTFSGHLKTMFSGKKVTFRTRYAGTFSDNDYPYKDISVSRTHPPEKRRKKAAWWHHNLLQEFFLPVKSSGMLSARIWWQQAYREIAPPLGVTRKGDENQLLTSLKIVADYSDTFSGWFLKGLFGYVYDDHHYKNTTAFIDSRNYSGRFTSRWQLKKQLTDKLYYNAGVRFSHIRVLSNNYTVNPVQRRWDVQQSCSYQFHKRLSGHLFLKKSFITDYDIPIIPMVGLEYQILRQHKLFLKASISKNYHAPTLNDLYWNPGGNPNLQPEQGLIYELGIKESVQFKNNSSLNFELTGFYGDIKQWIFWMPDEINSYWTPQNLKEVTTQGLETTLKWEMPVPHGILRLKPQFYWTRTTNQKPISIGDGSVGKQLIYVPEFTASVLAHVLHKKSSAQLVWNYTGKRFTSTDNSSWMPAYQLLDLRLSRKVVHQKYQGTYGVMINNVLNTDYQVIAWYPMPGRAVQIFVKWKK
jgi:iron complex outermembrane receptor protein